MPIIFESDTGLDLGQTPETLAPESAGPSLGKTLGAAFRRENAIGSAIASGLDQVNADEYFGSDDKRNPTAAELPDGFNPFKAAVDSGYDENELDALIRSNPKTQADFQEFDFSLKRQREDAAILEDAGATGIISQVAASLLDPSIFVGGQAAVKAAKGIRLGAKLVNMGKVAKGAPMLAKGVGGASLAAVEGTVAQELGLQASQTGRSVEDSALNVAGAAVAGPVLIGGVTAVAHMFGGKIGRYDDLLKRRGTDINDLGNRFADDMENVSDLEAMQKNMDDVLNSEVPNDLSAAATDFTGIRTTLEDETLAKAFGIEKASKFMTPLLRTLQSPSIKVRQFSQNLFENSMLMNKIKAGFAQEQSVERLVKMTVQDAEGHISYVRKSYAKYLRENGVQGWNRVTNQLGVGENPLTYDKFKEEITKAMRAGDDHADMVVRDAAKNARQFYNKILERGKEAGVFPQWMRSDTTQTAQSYINRIYNTDKIIREEDNWRAIIRPHITMAVRAAIADFHQVQKAKVDRFDGQIQRLEFENVKLRDAINNTPTKGGSVDVMDIERMADVDVADAQRRLAGLTNEEFIRTRNLGDVDPEAVARSRYAEVLRENPDPDVSLDDIEAIVEQYNLQNILADVQFVTQKRPPKPVSLVDYIVKLGGLRDTDGDLAAMGITNKARVGIINKRAVTMYARGKKGLELDDALDYAVQNGYMREGSDTDDLLEALDLHFRHDMPTYLDDDLETVRLLQQIDDVSENLSQFGVSNPRQLYRDIVEAAKAERAGARADLKAAKERQKLSKDIANQVREDLKKNVNPKLSELYNARKYMKAKAEAQIKRNEARAKELKDRRDWSDVNFREKLRDKYKFDGEDMNPYIDEVVRNVTDKITKRNAGMLPQFITMAERGALKGRTFKIDDQLIEGYLVNDIEQLMASYARHTGADIELKSKFGTLDVEYVVQEINDDYDEIAESIRTDKKLKAEERAKKLSNLETYRQRDVRDLKAGWDIARGTYKQNLNDPDNYFVRGAHALRALNYLRIGGGFVLSSLTDIAMPIFVHGMRRYYGDFLPSLINNLKGVKLQIADARKLRIAVEHEQAAWIAAYSELGDPYAKGTKFERFLSNASRNLGKISGMAYWNNFGQKIASSISQTRILTAIEDSVSGKIAKSEDEYLNFLGIDKAMRKKIYDQYKATRSFYADYETDGLKIAGVERWKDDEALTSYRAALGKDVDRTILQRGTGDVPLFFNTELGKTLTQFKSFSMAAHSKLLIAGLQRRDAAMVSGVGHLFALGMMVNYLKHVESGRKMSDNPADWVIDGFDRSGVMPIIFEIANTADKVNVGPRSMLGLGQSSRFAARSAVDSFLGPSVGLLVDSTSVVSAMAGDGPMSSSDYHKMRRMMWGQSLPFVRQGLDAMEEAYGPSQTD